MNAIDVAFVTACTALVTGTLGPAITFRIGRAQIAAAVISANRQRWIEGLRAAIASFCSQAVIAAVVRERLIAEDRILATADAGLLQRLQDLLQTFNQIKLMTNPAEDDHRRLLSSLDRIFTTLRTAPLNTDLDGDIRASVDDVVAATQAILKVEWERVKRGR